MDGDLAGGYEGVRPAGSSAWEPGQTPVNDVHLGFDSWTEYAEMCGASRVWSGVHFWPSVQVLDEIGQTVGTAAFKYWESLMLGNEPLRGEFKPLPPDPLLGEEYILYSEDTVLDDPFASSEYTPTKVWADFGVVHNPPLAVMTRDHQFDMVNGNALHGVFIPHLAPFIKQEVSPTLSDPSPLFRYVALLLNGAFDAVAPYHETAVGVSSRIDHRPPSEYETNENPNTAVMYAEYRMMLEFAPHRTDDWRFMMTVHGFDPDDESGLDLDCSVPQEISSPVAIGNFAGKCVLDAHRNDGFNQLGLETDGVAFGDTTGYVPVNTHDVLNDPSRWQPLLAPNLQGELVPQTFVTPQYANVEPYSDFDPRSIRVPPPLDSNHENMEAYKAQVDAVIEESHNITDEQKMLVEFFDNKLRGSLFRPVLSDHHDTVEFVQWDFLVNMANYDTGIVVWQEKARHDAVRPATAIPYVYGDELIKARGPPGGEPVEIPASEWTSYVNTANHPEYPSATASFCVTDAVVWRLYSGTDEIGKYVNMDGDLVGGYEGVRPAGSSAWEPGQTPVNDVHLGFDSWTEYAELCGASRVWSGVHSWPSVQVLDEIGQTVGTAAFKYWESLMLGNEPLRGEFKPLPPDPLLGEEYILYSEDTVLDDPFASSEYTPTKVWADFGVVHNPPLAVMTRDHQFDMVNGNALHGVFIPHLAPFIKQEVSPTLSDPSPLFRYVALLLNGAFDAVAPYHETAVGVSSRIDHRPPSEYETNENPNTAVMYAEYRMMLEFAPHRTDDWRFMMTVHGFDPDDESGLDLDCSVPQEISSPVAIGNFAGKCVLDAHRNDGFNQLGLETDGVAFGDTTGYVPVNTHDVLNDPSRWQPLLAPNLQGELVPQTFVTPQYANVEPYSDFDPRSIRVPPPLDSNHENMEAYKAQVDAVIEESHNITDEQKMLVEFFDNKLRGSLFRPVLSDHHDTVEFVQWDFLVNMANYDTGIVVWQEKARHDAVRPATAIPYVYGDELIKARGPPGGEPVEIPASEWTSYVNTANHPEYPSATASFCATDAVVWRLYSGTDEIGCVLETYTLIL